MRPVLEFRRSSGEPLRLRILGPNAGTLSWLAGALFAVATVLAGSVPSAMGADAPSVGSRIPDSEAVVRPVHVIDRKEIERSGMSTIQELLVSRSGYNNFGLYRPQLGATVYMIDGRRISGLNSAFVLESLPVPAVERIEFISDGAAALYAAARPARLTSCCGAVSRARRPGPARSDRRTEAAKSRMPAPCGAARSGAAA